MNDRLQYSIVTSIRSQELLLKPEQPSDRQVDFNPYVEWLEIDEALLPPNHYDLLGLVPFEKDSQKIQDAFEERISRLRIHQAGPRSRYSLQLIDQVTQARICLLHEVARTQYDEKLRQSTLQPPLVGNPLTSGSAPPIQDNAIQVSPDDSRNSSAGNESKGRANRSLKGVLVYVAGCLALVLVTWGVIKLTRGDSNQLGAAESESVESGDQQADAAENEPKKIVNLIEQEKGILPGANNSFLLNPANGSVDDANPQVVDTSDGQLYGKWTSPKNKVRWDIWINKHGYYEAIVKYDATTNDSFSRLVMMNGNDFRKSTKMRQAENQGSFFEEEFVLLFEKPGAHELGFSIEGEVGDFRLHSITLRPNRTTQRFENKETEPELESFFNR